MSNVNNPLFESDESVEESDDEFCSDLSYIGYESETDDSNGEFENEDTEVPNTNT